LWVRGFALGYAALAEVKAPLKLYVPDGLMARRGVSPAATSDSALDPDRARPGAVMALRTGLF